MIESLQDRILTAPSSFPDIVLHSGFLYLGEYHWHPESRKFDRWSTQDGLQAFAVPIRPTVGSYVCEHGSYDYSVNRTVSAHIPARWLLSKMGLRLSSKQSFTFVRSDGREVFYDPSVVEAGPSAGLVDRNLFLEVLDAQGLSAIWVIAGEKNAYGESDRPAGFVGHLRHTGIYCLDGDDFRQEFYTDRIRPSADYLEKLAREEPTLP